MKRAEAYALRWSDHAPVSVEYGLDDGRFGFGGGRWCTLDLGQRQIAGDC